ncbi:MAG: PD-(D/E)XK nuclease family protein, partial [Acidobacteria bacterium]|nr:PD-(D/E)XK nuclease family protein [Acidobacteriota bacterium]
LDRLLETTAERLLRQEGIALTRLVRPLVVRARPHLEVLRQHLWPGGQTLLASGSEVEGSLTVSFGDELQPLTFRADLVRRHEGRWQLIDLKTGRPLSRNKTPSGRRAELQRAVSGGERLQAVAYLLAAEQVLGAEAGEEVALGSYLFLDPQAEEEAREVTVGGADLDLKEAFKAVVDTTLTAWWQGAFPPRLVDAKGEKEPRRCQYCPVAEACLRGDSGARRRLLRVTERLSSETSPEPSGLGAVRTAERVFVDLWNLGGRG